MLIVFLLLLLDGTIKSMKQNKYGKINRNTAESKAMFALTLRKGILRLVTLFSATSARQVSISGHGQRILPLFTSRTWNHHRFSWHTLPWITRPGRAGGH